MFIIESVRARRNEQNIFPLEKKKWKRQRHSPLRTWAGAPFKRKLNKNILINCCCCLFEIEDSWRLSRGCLKTWDVRRWRLETGKDGIWRCDTMSHATESENNDDISCIRFRLRCQRCRRRLTAAGYSAILKYHHLFSVCVRQQQCAWCLPAPHTHTHMRNKQVSMARLPNGALHAIEPTTRNDHGKMENDRVIFIGNRMNWWYW